MPKIENQGILNPEDISTALCPICGAVLTFTRNKNEEYYSEHCDRVITLHATRYIATIEKNPNVTVAKYQGAETHKLNHPEYQDKWRKYV